MFELPLRGLIKTLVRFLNKADPSALDDIMIFNKINQSMRVFDND